MNRDLARLLAFTALWIALFAAVLALTFHPLPKGPNA